MSEEIKHSKARGFVIGKNKNEKWIKIPNNIAWKNQMKLQENAKFKIGDFVKTKSVGDIDDMFVCLIIGMVEKEGNIYYHLVGVGNQYPQHTFALNYSEVAEENCKKILDRDEFITFLENLIEKNKELSQTDSQETPSEISISQKNPNDTFTLF